ncbi:MAG: protein translocase subunit SecF [Gammaproteobacteria bacterium]|nr:MAG: protein translocase subunit SecF [Gammaproteobacteria bacterium]
MKTFNFDFMRWRLAASMGSGVALLVSVVTLAFAGLNFGLDFTGGTLVEVGYPKTVVANDVRVQLENAGFNNAVVQNFGTDTDLLIRVPSRPEIDQATLGDQIQALLREAEPEMEVRRSEFVGPAVGAELRETAGLAMLVALGAVMLYIMFRFTGKFSIGAVTALIHDVIITLGMFAIFRWTFDLAVLAAVLAVIGYSLNDTIVVSDRIRENFRKMRRGGAMEIINRSLNQTLGRTVVTSFTTLLVLLALLIFGGELIRGFAIALIIGVFVGTYSSIYVASNMLMVLGIRREDLVVPERERLPDDVP